MNQSLKEFKELRLIYSGRIDAAIKINDEELLYKAKVEYSQVLEKYVNIACQIISNHTNKPFIIYKKTDTGIKYLSKKKVLNNLKSIKESLYQAKLPEAELENIKIAIEVVTDYYEKVVIESNVKYRKDDIQFKFQIIFGSLIAPITIFIAAYLNSFIISNWAPNLQKITKVTDFYDFNIVDTKSAIFLLLIFVIDFMALVFLSKMYIKKSDESLWDKKKFMLIPIGIMKSYLYIMPISFILKGLLGRKYMMDIWQITTNMFALLLIIFIFVLALFSLLSDNFSSRGYKSKLNTMDLLFILVIVITTIIPYLYVIIAQVLDFPIAQSIPLVNVGLLILYLGFAMYFINYEIYTNDKYKSMRKWFIIVDIMVIIIAVVSQIHW